MHKLSMSILPKQVPKLPMPNFNIQVRHARNKPLVPVLRKGFLPKLYYSFEERIKEKDKVLNDPELYRKINIGFSTVQQSSSKSEIRISKRKELNEIRVNLKLEKQARDCTLNLDIEEIQNEWKYSTRPKDISALATKYDIYQHLFGDFAFFFPVIPMDIFYEFGEDSLSPVYTGNLLKPQETTTTPIVEFKSDAEDLWTLVLSNPDGNLYDNNSEMLHWMVVNIPGGDVTKGEEVVDYMRPIPPKGTGFHRYCFVLYKQTKKEDFSQYRRESPCLNLKQRTFQTKEFYKQFEDTLTPAGLSWFQADYDSSLSDFFHKELRMKEPQFLYEFPKPFKAPQRLFPHLKPFNRYLDLHRDPKDMQKIMLLKRLALTHPIQGDEPRLPFPLAKKFPRQSPVWMKNEIIKEAEGSGKYKDVYRGDDRPYKHVGNVNRFPFSDLY